MKGEAKAHIDAPPEAVWALIADITRMGEWSPECRGGEWLDGGGPDVGARFKGSNKAKLPWTTTSTVTEAVPGKVFAWKVGKDTTWRYELTAQDGGTDVVESFDVLRAPGAVGRAVNRLGTGVPWSGRGEQLVAGMEQTLANLKRVAEGSGAG
jgi:uncharacterized protein YndB with AHSA1/START domain